MSKQKILLIGWDAADWKIINPLMDAGKMPALSKLVDEGVMGNIATLEPVISPILWSSIATGKYADKHGVLGFTETLPMNGGVMPVQSTSRKTKALWNILMQNGYKSHVLGWWPSHPAEPLNGITVSNFYAKASGKNNEDWKIPPKGVHPEAYNDLFKSIRVHPTEITGDLLLPFVPLLDKVDQEKDSSLISLATNLCEAVNYHSIATWILENEEWDFLGIYLNAIDAICHRFMKFHPPKLAGLNQDMYDKYKDVINASYIFHDMMLERLMKLAGEDATIVLVSDHGFNSDDRRLLANPNEPAGIAYDHRQYGIFCMKGPGIKKDERVYGASLLDVAPTLLAAADLPIGSDMDGKALLQVFDQEKELNYIESWDAVDGDSGMHSSPDKAQHFTSKEELQQLIDLGYIDDPGDDLKLAMESSNKENKFNLVRTYISSNRFAKAYDILIELVESYPEEARYQMRLALVCQKINKPEEALKWIDSLKELAKKPPKIDPDTKKKKDAVSKTSLKLLEANIHLENHETEKALELFDDLEEAMPYSAKINIQKGRAYGLDFKAKKAKVEYGKALEKDEENASAWVGLSRCHFLLEENEEAADAALNAINLIYFYPNAHYYLGQALNAMGEYEAAAQALEVCLGQNPAISKARNTLMNIYEKRLNQPEKANEHRNFFENLKNETVYIVSGIPRSGTSLMMQMLNAGGLEIFSDQERQADENNPKGYYEHEKVKNLAIDKSWLPEAKGKCVKIISQLLFHLPDNLHFKIIFMKRDLNEVIDSQRAMLKRDGKQVKEGTYPMGLHKAYEKNMQNIESWAESKNNVDMIYVDYHDLLKKDPATINKITDLVESKLDIDLMTEQVDTNLYRSKKTL